jgi:ribose 5-phosphate isomerase B
MRKIYIGADSAGYYLKKEFCEHLTSLGYEVTDLGAYDAQSSHYPVFANAVCESVKSDLSGSFGILICGTGIGMSMCANKHKGIRAAVCSDTFSAKMTRIHNDANVLCIGARVVGPSLAVEILDAFLASEFEAGGRHELRVNMIRELEK